MTAGDRGEYALRLGTGVAAGVSAVFEERAARPESSTKSRMTLLAIGLIAAAGLVALLVVAGLKRAEAKALERFVFPKVSVGTRLGAPYGGGIHAPEHHSESTEALFAHVPGLKVVIPSSPARAYGLLLGAIADPDPVVFLEPKRVYRSLKEPVADDGLAMALGEAHVLRPGTDLTLMSWGAMLVETRAAAEALAAEGIAAEVIDVCSLKPLDTATLLASVRKTGRAVIVHEANVDFGIGAEIAAQLHRELFDTLKAPVLRVGSMRSPVPYSKPLEAAFVPTQERITAAVRQVLK
jgi:pyruvate dehydrogenase E1 component beta subunit